ncbi:MAG: NAD(P)/FAD-dependent oxidoreductase [Rhodothermales bacterium]
MQPSVDVLIVGAGLAGASAAHHIRASGKTVCVLHTNALGRNASQIGGGLINPMMARKGRPAWMAAEALDALEALGVDTYHCLPHHDVPLYRPARDTSQADAFREQALANPTLGRFREADTVAAGLDYLRAPFGVLEVLRGAAVNLEATATAWLGDTEVNLIDPDWQAEDLGDGVRVHTSRGEFRAARLLLCMGAGMLTHPLTRTLKLQGIKGQLIRLEKAAALPERLPPLSGIAYLVDAGDGSVWVGSTFERDWASLETTPEGRLQLQERAAEVIPALRGARVLEHRAAQRITVPGTRLPMLGSLYTDSNIWVFTGLGSKGMLYAALFGSRIPVFFNNPEAIPAMCRVVHRSAES